MVEGFGEVWRWLSTRVGSVVEAGGASSVAREQVRVVALPWSNRDDLRT